MHSLLRDWWPHWSVMLVCATKPTHVRLLASCSSYILLTCLCIHCRWISQHRCLKAGGVMVLFSYLWTFQLRWFILLQHVLMLMWRVLLNCLWSMWSGYMVVLMMLCQTGTSDSQAASTKRDDTWWYACEHVLCFHPEGDGQTEQIYRTIE